MKKVKFIKALNVVIFLLFVLVLPTVCAFIPYGEPVVVDDKIEAVLVEEGGSNFVLKIDVKNPTMVRVTSMELDLAVLKTGWEEGMTEDNMDDWVIGHYGKVTFEGDIGWFGRRTLEHDADIADDGVVQGIVDGSFEFVSIDGYYTYTKLGAYWYYMIGLVIFCLVSLLFSKQKFYFKVGSDDVEVYATMSRTVLSVNGQIIEDKLHKGQDTTIVHKLGEDEIKITIGRPVVSPNLKIAVNGKEPTFTNVRQNCFIKLQDKKKNF